MDHDDQIRKVIRDLMNEYPNSKSIVRGIRQLTEEMLQKEVEITVHPDQAYSEFRDFTKAEIWYTSVVLAVARWGSPSHLLELKAKLHENHPAFLMGDRRKARPLHHAAREGNLPIVLKLLEEPIVRINVEALSLHPDTENAPMETALPAKKKPKAFKGKKSKKGRSKSSSEDKVPPVEEVAKNEDVEEKEPEVPDKQPQMGVNRKETTNIQCCTALDYLLYGLQKREHLRQRGSRSLSELQNNYRMIVKLLVQLGGMGTIFYAKDLILQCKEFDQDELDQKDIFFWKTVNSIQNYYTYTNKNRWCGTLKQSLLKHNGDGIKLIEDQLKVYNDVKKSEPVENTFNEKEHNRLRTLREILIDGEEIKKTRETKPDEMEKTLQEISPSENDTNEAPLSDTFGSTALHLAVLFHNQHLLALLVKRNWIQYLAVEDELKHSAIDNAVDIGNWDGLETMALAAQKSQIALPYDKQANITGMSFLEKKMLHLMEEITADNPIEIEQKESKLLILRTETARKGAVGLEQMIFVESSGHTGNAADSQDCKNRTENKAFDMTLTYGLREQFKQHDKWTMIDKFYPYPTIGIRRPSSSDRNVQSEKSMSLGRNKSTRRVIGMLKNVLPSIIGKKNGPNRLSSASTVSLTEIGQMLDQGEDPIRFAKEYENLHRFTISSLSVSQELIELVTMFAPKGAIALVVFNVKALWDAFKARLETKKYNCLMEEIVMTVRVLTSKSTARVILVGILDEEPVKENDRKMICLLGGELEKCFPCDFDIPSSTSEPKFPYVFLPIHIPTNLGQDRIRKIISRLLDRAEQEVPTLDCIYPEAIQTQSKKPIHWYLVKDKVIKLRDTLEDRGEPQVTHLDELKKLFREVYNIQSQEMNLSLLTRFEEVIEWLSDNLEIVHFPDSKLEHIVFLSVGELMKGIVRLVSLIKKYGMSAVADDDSASLAESLASKIQGGCGNLDEITTACVHAIYPADDPLQCSIAKGNRALAEGVVSILTKARQIYHLKQKGQQNPFAVIRFCLPTDDVFAEINHHLPALKSSKFKRGWERDYMQPLSDRNSTSIAYWIATFGGQMPPNLVQELMSVVVTRSDLEAVQPFRSSQGVVLWQEPGQDPRYAILSEDKANNCVRIAIEVKENRELNNDKNDDSEDDSDDDDDTCSHSGSDVKPDLQNVPQNKNAKARARRKKEQAKLVAKLEKERRSIQLFALKFEYMIDDICRGLRVLTIVHDHQYFFQGNLFQQDKTTRDDLFTMGPICACSNESAHHIPITREDLGMNSKGREQFVCTETDKYGIDVNLKYLWWYFDQNNKSATTTLVWNPPCYTWDELKSVQMKNKGEGLRTGDVKSDSTIGKKVMGLLRPFTARFDFCKIKRITLIDNALLQARFDLETKFMAARWKDTASPLPPLSNDQRKLLRDFNARNIFTGNEADYQISLHWHGCSLSAAEGIMKVGALNLCKLSDYFGSGICVTPNPDYAARYAFQKGPFERFIKGRTGCLMLFATVTGRVLPLDKDLHRKNTKSASDFHGRPLLPPFDAHLASVSFESSLMLSDPNEQDVYHELIVRRGSQLLPLLVVYFDVVDDEPARTPQA